MPVTSPPPICIGEYLASEIYPNHDLEFRRQRSINRFVGSIFHGDKCDADLGYNEVPFSSALETCYYCFHDQCNDSFPGERRFVKFVKKKKFDLFEEISRGKTLFLLRLNRVFERRMVDFSRRV